MCGRYTLIRHNHLVEIIPNFTTPVNLRMVSRYNIAPTQDVPALFPTGELQVCRWGLIPHWSKPGADDKIAYSMINARAETLLEKPAYRKLLDDHRCILPADGFYEWKKEGTGGRRKTPMYIRMKGGGIFGFAGLWDSWRDADGRNVLSCTIITTGPNDLVRPIHDRMPAILKPDDFSTWLCGDVNDALKLLVPFDAAAMETFAVGSLVNAPKNELSACIEPAPIIADPPPEPTVKPRKNSKKESAGETGMLF